MSLKPVHPQEQVIKACQVGLTVISSEGTAIPGNLLDGTASFKNLLIGVIQGNLFICQNEAPEKEQGEKLPDAPTKDEASASSEEAVKTPRKTVRKKASKKVARKKA